MKKWILYGIVIFLLLCGLVFSVFFSPIWYDDTGHFLVAREIAKGNGMCYPIDSNGENCIPNSSFITMGPVQAYPLALWMEFFGHTMLAARACMVLLSLLAILAFFRVAKWLTSSMKALLSIGIVSLNIQFLTYGAEVLGEVPMMGMVLIGIGCFLCWDKNGDRKWALGGILSWCLAVGIKEYAILPLCLSMGIWWLWREINKDQPLRVLYAGIGFAIALFLILTIIHGNPGSLIQHFLGRQSYGSEFFALNLAISLKFLLFKPLFWLGTGAMVLKWKVKQRMEEVLTLSVQAAWFIFYLLSAGYDRFGFLLLFLPAIYTAEFIPYFWKEAGRTSHWAWLRRAMLICLSLVVFGQQTWWVFGKRILQPGQVNAIEKAALQHLDKIPARLVVTAEQQMALFLPEIRREWRLISMVPSQANRCNHPSPEFRLAADELFLAGPYAFTEYEKCIDWQSLTAVDSVVVGEEMWIIYRGK